MTFRPIPVFFAVDENYAPFLAVALASLLDHAAPGSVEGIHVLTETLGENEQNRLRSVCRGKVPIEFVNVSDLIRSFGSSLHLRDYYTKATYYRFFIPSLFPQYDTCLYLDCDILVRGDVADLCRIPLDNCLIAASVDDVVLNDPIFGLYTAVVLGIPPKEYINAGVLVMNLAAMRKEKTEEKFASLLSVRRFPVAQDQDYLNVLCKKRIYYLPGSWNQTAFPDLGDEDAPDLVHFKMNFKPWHYRDIPYERDFWRYAAQTPYLSHLRHILNNYGEQERDREQAQALLELAQEEIVKRDPLFFEGASL